MALEGGRGLIFARTTTTSKGVSVDGEKVAETMQGPNCDGLGEGEVESGEGGLRQRRAVDRRSGLTQGKSCDDDNRGLGLNWRRGRYSR